MCPGPCENGRIRLSREGEAERPTRKSFAALPFARASRNLMSKGNCEVSSACKNHSGHRAQRRLRGRPNRRRHPRRDFPGMFDVNLNSSFHILRPVIPHMRKTGAGRIIAIGSRAAEDPGASVRAYSASKAALVSLIRTVAIENKDAGITANVILPGTIDTPANRQAMPKADTSQWVQPASIADLILWLCGDGGKDVTGSAIPVYGKGL